MQRNKQVQNESNMKPEKLKKPKWRPACVCIFGPQPLPPAAETELQTVGLLSSIFIDWLSARASSLATVDTPRTALLPGFILFDIGIRVAVLRADGTSEPGWKINETTLGSVPDADITKHHVSRYNISTSKSEAPPPTGLGGA